MVRMLPSERRLHLEALDSLGELEELEGEDEKESSVGRVVEW